MLRQLSRGFQQSFIKRLYFETSETCGKDGRPSSTHQHNCCFTELLPSVFQSLHTCDLKQGESDKHKKGRHKEHFGNKPINHDTFFEACGWSGALAFGCIITKQLWLKSSLIQDQHVDGCNNGTILRYCSVTQLFNHIVKTQPPVASILPQLQLTPSLTSDKDVSTKSSDLDDGFESAAKELQEIHEKVIGEALNRQGLACLSNSTYSKAILYFQRASQLKYPPASFNMGQCCELGIGTNQDFKQAAGWYKIASEQGHATAMYNLGVFYAHGWGGLKADINSAKKLFIQAAKLGQPDAKAALDEEAKFMTHIVCKTNNTEIHCFNDIHANTTDHAKINKLNLVVCKLKSELTDYAHDFALHSHVGSKNQWDGSLSTTVII